MIAAFIALKNSKIMTERAAKGISEIKKGIFRRNLAHAFIRGGNRSFEEQKLRWSIRTSKFCEEPTTVGDKHNIPLDFSATSTASQLQSHLYSPNVLGLLNSDPRKKRISRHIDCFANLKCMNLAGVLQNKEHKWKEAR